MSEGGATIGERMAGFSLPDTSGEQRGLPGAGEASATLVVWTCNHCPYALAWHDRLIEVATEYAERGVRSLMINSNDAERYPADSPEAMRERHQAAGWSVPYLHDADQSVAWAWDAKTTPDVFLLDGEGRLAYRGAPDADHQRPELAADWLRQALEAVLAERPADPVQTDSVGCSIKWLP